MRIVVTGNPNYEGLCSGIWEAYSRNQVEFIGRWNDWDLTDADAVAEYVKDHNVFVNSQYGPNGEQVELLRKVYEKFNGEHIINKRKINKTHNCVMVKCSNRCGSLCFRPFAS